MPDYKIIKNGENIKFVLTFRPWYWPFSKKVKEYFVNFSPKAVKACYKPGCLAWHNFWIDGDTGELVKCSINKLLNEQTENLIRKHSFTQLFIKDRFVLNENAGYREPAGIEEEYEQN